MLQWRRVPDLNKIRDRVVPKSSKNWARFNVSLRFHIKKLDSEPVDSSPNIQKLQRVSNKIPLKDKTVEV